MNTVPIWVGIFGQYKIPDRLLDVRINKYGWPDKRYKAAELFMQWVREQEDLARQNI